MIPLVALVLTSSAAEAKRHNRAHKARAGHAATATTDARYADIILNPQTGEIYHQHDPDGKRYPASLTKMMTLYLLFEALEKRKVSLEDNFPVSDLASRQPQTNLALSEGDRIPVETAIKALVVRSANDVAIVVAEALGGDVDHFAQMMTAKARQLGMKNTVFKNPNGLPNLAQHTTARDMAKLGIALKRDFPKYYRYFSTLEFSHAGVTYYTHNRVMLRYAGVDGIKTGFIGASGFNLVTSVVRGGRPLVGVVMGGSSGRWRDDQMIRLLDQSYAVIASRGGARGKGAPVNLPDAKNDKPPVDLPDSSEEEEGGEAAATPVAPAPVPAKPATPVAAPAPAASASSGGKSAVAPAVPAAAPVAALPAASAPRAPVSALPSQAPFAPVSPAVSPAPASPAPAAVAPAAPRAVPVAPMGGAPAVSVSPVDAAERGWGIQVGAFSSEALAQQAVHQALQAAPTPLAHARMAIASPALGATPVFRARLDQLGQGDARKACEALIHFNMPCFIYRAAE